MEKEDAEEMYRKWRERKGISKRSDVEKETDREKYKRALMEAEEEKNPFENLKIRSKRKHLKVIGNGNGYCSHLKVNWNGEDTLLER